MTEYSFTGYLYYGNVDGTPASFSLNALPLDTEEAAFAELKRRRDHYGAEGMALYVPGEHSNEHFPGPCLKTLHSYGTQIHRPGDVYGAGRHDYAQTALGRSV